MTQNLSAECRKNIVFEILEEKYGIIDKLFIEHVRILQTMGFSIAIDDLYVSEKNNGMSLEILNELLEVGIYPDYIKLDGKHCMAIQDDSITDTELGKIITLI
jgi:EAL domain-containing protein (putative c-di-GMP-specific phosphodiesterase class I)